MVVFVPALILLGALSGLLWLRVTQLKRQLRKNRHESAADASLETEKSASLQASNDALRGQNARLQARLDDMQQELASLSYSVSHDLRAPLRSINGFSQALSEDYGPRLDAAAQDYLRRVRAGSLHMNALIDELLTLSRTVRAPFHPETLDLSALAWETARALAGTEPGRRVEWLIQPDLTAWGDRALLGAALRHLLGNAWKFTAGRAVAHVGFRAVTDADGAAYEVRDDGVGFDMQYAGRLFGVFQRMHAAGEFAGHGTGLATVQRIVRRHGGEVRAAAQPGEGATFTFTLAPCPQHSAGAERLLPPLAAPEASTAARPPVHSSPTAV